MASEKFPCVYVATEFDRLAAAVQSELPQVTVKKLQLTSTETLTETDLKDVTENADVLLADAEIIADIMYSSEKLRWAQSTSADFHHLIRASLKKIPYQKGASGALNLPLPKAILTRSGHGYGSNMAEYVLGFILSIERMLPQMNEDQKRRLWKKSEFGKFRPLSQLRIGVIGAGNIGMEIGRTCKSLGMEVWALTRTRKPSSVDKLQPDVYKTVEQLPELLENCDYVCCVLPDTKNTTDLLSGDLLSHCKIRKSVFINIGRGNVISEDSIVKAITNGWISHAVLDVFQTEPLPKNSELWSLPNVHITPHISGASTPGQLAGLFAQNYHNFINGMQLNYVVNWNDGY